MMPGYFLDALIHFDRRKVKFMTHRAIRTRPSRRRHRAINNNQELTDHERQLNNVSIQFIMRANCAYKNKALQNAFFLSKFISVLTPRRADISGARCDIVLSVDIKRY